jgi:hypothetical protein
MATKTTPKAKATATPKAKPKMPKARSVFGKGGHSKPTNTREHIVHRISKRADKHGWARFVRGLHRLGLAQAERARERREALRMGRESIYPTWSQRVGQRRQERKSGQGQGRARSTNYCAGCGKTMSAAQLRTHDCGSQSKTGKAKATTPTPQAPQAPPAAPSSAAAAPAPTRRQRLRDRLSGKTEMPAQPTTTPTGAVVTPIAGSKPATPPATAGANNNEGSPQMAWGKPSNGSTSGGASASGGGSSGAASSATVGAMLTPWTAWAQNVPKTHIEMVAELEAMNQLMVAIGQTIRERQARMINMGTGPNGEQIGFHPTCVQQLNGAADQISAAGAYFTATHVAITAHYQALIQHYQGGTPDPGRQYLSNAS